MSGAVSNEACIPVPTRGALTNQLWAIAHGLASLELQGCLGPSEVAEEAWRSVVSTMVAGMTQTHPADSSS